MHSGALIPDGGLINVVVVTLSFNAKMDLADLECNLKTDSKHVSFSRLAAANGVRALSQGNIFVNANGTAF